MRAGVLLALLALASCAFGSEREFFTAADGAQPFENGAHWMWVESEDFGNRVDLVFERGADGRYTAAPTSGEEPIRGVLFVPITSTPEEDYVVQVRLKADDDGAVYAFLWRTDAGYRLVADPGRLTEDDDLSTADAYCVWQTYQSCSISRRDDVFSIYAALVYSRFVVGGETPESYVDLLPPGAPLAPRRPTKD